MPFFYAPNFGKVGRACCLWLVSLSLSLSLFKSLMCKNIHNSEPLEVNIADSISNDNV